jgi:hypothetical protein
MGLIIDGTTIATSANVYVDGVAVNNVYIDGTLVWTKAAAKSWKTAWSGSVILDPYGIDSMNGSGDAGTVSATVTGAISGSIIQVDGIYYQDIFDLSSGSVVDQVTETITANKSTSNPAAMSTYYASTTSIGAYLNKPTYSGSTITLSAYTGYQMVYDSYMSVEYFEVTAVYYYA